MGDIPPDLDQLEPGLLLALFLESAGELDTSGYDRTVVLRAYQKMASHFQAKVYQTMVAIHEVTDSEIDLSSQEKFEWAALEVGCALRLTRRSSESDLDFALQLCRRVPRVVATLASGEIDLRRARVLVNGTQSLPAQVAREVVDQVIGDAAHLTSGQLYARLRKLCIQANPDDAKNRYQNALADRRLIAEASPDGTTHLLGLDLPPDRVAEILARINNLARSLKSGSEGRNLDQIRADVFLDLLDGRDLHGTDTKGVVDIHVDLATLAELNEHPGELSGYGPVIADIARQVAELQQRSEWRWSLTDPHTSGVICSGTTRRRPTNDQRRQVVARRPTCIFPGCRVPAIQCDLDHRHPWSEGGPTCTHNLEPLCRFHHRARHRHNWIRQPLPDGDHVWTSPLGRRYTTSGRSP